MKFGLHFLISGLDNFPKYFIYCLFDLGCVKKLQFLGIAKKVLLQVSTNE
jgi:hypothetical protein